MHHSFKRALAVLLSILLAAGNLGLTAFAGSPAANPANVVHSDSASVPAALAEPSDAEGVPYLDENGETAYRTDYTLLTGSETAWTGWYVAEGAVNIGSRVTVSGAAHLILADGAALTIPSGIDVSGGNSLTIYAQSTGDGMGALTVDAAGYRQAGIGGSNASGGVITINGGRVEASGGQYSAGIGGGYVGTGGVITINGGAVTSTGGSGGAGIGGGHGGSGGEITIRGGEVTATGGTNGAGIGGGNVGAGGEISICGGKITANGYIEAAGVGPGSNYGGSTYGTLTMSLSAADESIRVSRYKNNMNKYTQVSVKGGCYLQDGSGNVYSGTLSNATLDTLADAELRWVWVDPWVRLQDAIEAAPSGSTISLGDYADADRRFVCPANLGALTIYKELTLDLQGCVLDRHLSEAQTNGFVIEITSHGILTLEDSLPDRENSLTVSGNPVTVMGGVITGGNNTANGGGVINRGTFTMTGGTVCGNMSPYDGGGVASSGTFTMSGSASVTGNTANRGGGVAISGSNLSVASFTMSGSASVAGNTAAFGGGGVYSSGAFTMSGNASVYGNTAGLGGGVAINTSGAAASTFTMSESASVIGNTASERGGGVFVTSNCTFAMTGSASLAENTSSEYGGGVNNYGTFTMSDSASVAWNQSIIFGGGVANYGTFHVYQSASVTMNTADQGGGVFNDTPGTFSMSGSASLNGNISETLGGGVYNKSTFTTSDSASITGNTANQGGGGAYNSGIITMSGGSSIAGNAAVISGGGVYNDTPGTFSMSGSASVTGNITGPENGGGVYIYSGSTFTVSGSARVTGNKGNRVDNNVQLGYNSSPITVDGTLTGNARIGVKMKTPGVFTDGLSGRGTAASFISDDDAYRVRSNSSGEAELFTGFATYQVLISSVGGTVTADRGTESGPRAAEGDVVTLTITPNPGYAALESLTVNGVDVTAAVSDGSCSFTMPAGDVTVTAAFAPDPAHFSANAAETEYTIHSAEGWDVFCDLLEYKPKGVFDGKTVVLGESISVSRMAGLSYHDFTGVFDGGGNTLRFTATAEEHYCAPFRYVQGASAESKAVIRNLKVESDIDGAGFRHPAGLIAMQSGCVDVIGCQVEVTITDTKNTDASLYPAGLVSQANNASELTISGCSVTGTITTDGMDAGGLIGIVQRSASIENCLCSVTIDSATVGDGTHGGLVGYLVGNCSLDIRGCVFNGSLLGENTNKVGGFVGWSSGSTTITDSLFAPAECSVQGQGSAAFARNGASITNSYYTQALGELQGKQAYAVTAEEIVTLGLVGTLSVYAVSGVTVSDARVGLQYGDVIYAAAGEALSIRLSCAYAACDSYFVNAGTLSGTENPYTLAMPARDVYVESGIDMPFFDVTQGNYYYGPVLWAVYHAPPITSGVSEMVFGPHLNCTRAQVVTFLWKAAGAPAPLSTENPFLDVPTDAYYCQPVLWALEQGITAGTDAEHFSPDKVCTRAEAVTFLYARQGRPAVDSQADTGFEDVSPDAYYHDAVLWAVSRGVTAGTDAAHFSPSANCTRAQMLTLLFRAMTEPS
ncbi:MAG: S-layer homology domain-containing protein [Oscillospiraceae bacterium]|nr:S-layer homology domain-containing protein [Oscillospiraceae bacterium]MBR7009776.1 S-layer homology domain-containing protein [Oscillospiraceae bacterium]